MLEVYPDLSVVAEAVDGEDAVLQAARFRPAVVIVDIHMPRMSGMDTTKMIKLKSPCTVVIALTAGEPDQEDRAMISAGASSVINKADVVCKLYPAILDAVNSIKTAS